MNIQSLKFRLKCAISTLTDLKNDNQIHIKATVIKTFLNNESYEKAVLRLTKTYNIHLLKHIPGDKKGIIYILSNFNSSFKSFVNYLKKLEIEFNIDSELAPGFNIPYYLSLILLDKRPDNPDENYSEETNEITMSILFKGFNCSTDEDKEYFLKDKDDILKEFNNICESVKRIIQFYRTNDGTKRERNEGFRDLSIKHILNDKFLNEIEDEIKPRYREQPILIFADSYKTNNQDKSDYDRILERLLKINISLSRQIIQIKTENDIAKNIYKIGKFDSITLATRIIGRGADIKVDKSIEKGLHLILTYYPERESVYIQMLGRTARQDEKGSYSEICRKPKNFSPVEEKEINPRNIKIQETTEYFYRNYR
ncbi:unnamed protein product, partial [Rotaria sp. Silwood2]